MERFLYTANHLIIVTDIQETDKDDLLVANTDHEASRVLNMMVQLQS